MKNKSEEISLFMNRVIEAAALCTSTHVHIEQVPFLTNDFLQYKFAPNALRISPTSITCCIPFGNDHPFLPVAINSIRQQTVPVQKITVGVDRSSIRTVADEFSNDPLTEYRFFHGSNGPFVIMEQLIRGAATEYILVMDSDDISHPDRIAILLHTAQATNSDIVGSASLHITEFGNQIIGLDIFPPSPGDALEKNMCHAALYPTLLIRRNAFIHLKGFAKFESFGMDSEFIIRATKYCKFQNVNIPLYFKRARPSSLTNASATGMVSHRRQNVLNFTLRRYRDIYDRA